MFGFGKPKEFNPDEYDKAKEDAERKLRAYQTMGSLAGVDDKQSVYDEVEREADEARDKVTELAKLADNENAQNVEKYEKMRKEVLASIVKLINFKRDHIAEPIDTSVEDKALIELKKVLAVGDEHLTGFESGQWASIKENTEGQKLEWGLNFPKEMTWIEAQAEITKLNKKLGKLEKPWRLPTKDELVAEFNKTGSTPAGFRGGEYWSGDEYPEVSGTGRLDTGYCVDMSDGHVVGPRLRDSDLLAHFVCLVR